MPYKVVLSFKSVDETLVCDHSNESYSGVLPCGTVYYAVQEVLPFESVDETLVCDHSNES